MAMTFKVQLNLEMVFLATDRRWGIGNRWVEIEDFVRHPTGTRTDPPPPPKTGTIRPMWSQALG